MKCEKCGYDGLIDQECPQCGIDVYSDEYEEIINNKHNKLQELSAKVIDLVIERILNANPEISIEDKKGNTLLYGEDYYSLEDEIVEMLDYPVVENGKRRN